MRSLILILFVFTFWMVFPFAAPGVEAPKIEYHIASDSVVMAKHQYGSNITCLATEEGLYFVDCGLNTELAGQFRKNMEKKFAKKTVALLLTHAHIDHFFGMGAFSDVKVISSETGKNLWDRQLSIEFNEKRIQAYDRIFSGRRYTGLWRFGSG